MPFVDWNSLPLYLRGILLKSVLHNVVHLKMDLKDIKNWGDFSNKEMIVEEVIKDHIDAWKKFLSRKILLVDAYSWLRLAVAASGIFNLIVWRIWIINSAVYLESDRSSTTHKRTAVVAFHFTHDLMHHEEEESNLRLLDQGLLWLFKQRQWIIFIKKIELRLYMGRIWHHTNR